MSTSSLPPTSSDEAPIDAEFEPAQSTTLASSKGPGAGPGWAAFMGLLVVSICALGLSIATAGWLPGFHPGSGQVSSLTENVDALSTQFSEDASETETLTSDIATLKSRADSLMADRTRASSEIRNLRVEIETLQADISTLQRARVASLANAGETSSEAIDDADLSGLERRVIALEDALVSQLGAYDTTLEGLKSRLSELEALAASDQLTAADASNARTEAALALSAIEAAARRGRPFLTAHQQLAAAMPNNDAIQRLAPIATKAVPTLADLRASYPALMQSALDQAAQNEGTQASWFRGVFGDGIQVRRVKDITPRDHMEHASAALQLGDLADCIEHVQALDPDLQSVFTDWLNNAQDRHVLEQTLEALRLTMIARERP